MANEDIKKLIKKHRLFRYEVAEAMGISEGYLSTLLRKPLTEEMRTRVLEAINKLSNQED
ncbi:MAG: helix-turn-helix domain-containing protein [Lachnospira sp.]